MQIFIFSFLVPHSLAFRKLFLSNSLNFNVFNQNYPSNKTVTLQLSSPNNYLSVCLYFSKFELDSPNMFEFQVRSQFLSFTALNARIFSESINVLKVVVKAFLTSRIELFQIQNIQLTNIPYSYNLQSYYILTFNKAWSLYTFTIFMLNGITSNTIRNQMVTGLQQISRTFTKLTFKISKRSSTGSQAVAPSKLLSAYVLIDLSKIRNQIQIGYTISITENNLVFSAQNRYVFNNINALQNNVIFGWDLLHTDRYQFVQTGHSPSQKYFLVLKNGNYFRIKLKYLTPVLVVCDNLADFTFVQSDSISCLHTCPIRYFYQRPFYTCSLCNFFCDTCVQVNSCLSCKMQQQSLDSVGQCVCKTIYFFKQNQKICSPCSIGCIGCLSAIFCFKCNQSFNLIAKQGSCLTCLKGFIAFEQKCNPCQSTCQTCRGLARNQCLSCKSGLVFQQGYCLKSTNNLNLIKLNGGFSFCSSLIHLRKSIQFKITRCANSLQISQSLDCTQVQVQSNQSICQLQYKFDTIFDFQKGEYVSGRAQKTLIIGNVKAIRLPFSCFQRVEEIVCEIKGDISLTFNIFINSKNTSFKRVQKQNMIQIWVSKSGIESGSLRLNVFPQNPKTNSGKFIRNIPLNSSINLLQTSQIQKQIISNFNLYKSYLQITTAVLLNICSAVGIFQFADLLVYNLMMMNIFNRLDPAAVPIFNNFISMLGNFCSIMVPSFINKIIEVSELSRIGETLFIVLALIWMTLVKFITKLLISLVFYRIKNFKFKFPKDTFSVGTQFIFTITLSILAQTPFVFKAAAVIILFLWIMLHVAFILVRPSKLKFFMILMFDLASVLIATFLRNFIIIMVERMIIQIVQKMSEKRRTSMIKKAAQWTINVMYALIFLIYTPFAQIINNKLGWTLILLSVTVIILNFIILLKKMYMMLRVKLMETKKAHRKKGGQQGNISKSKLKLRRLYMSFK